MKLLGVAALGCVATISAASCADLPGSDCTVLATCENPDGNPPPFDATFDVPMSNNDAAMDGPYPEGTVPDGFTNDGPCTGECVVVPSGWTGPVAWWEGMNGAPACAGAYTGAASDLHTGLNAPAATCSACMCGAPSGQVCTATVTTYTGYCTGVCDSSVVVSGNGCTSFNPCGTDGSPATTQYAEYSWAVSGGSCTASGGSPTLPATSWSTNARTCAYNASTGGSCATGTCYAPASTPFSGACVYQMGDVMCPPGFATQHVYYTTINDTRGCTPCGCGVATGSCSGNVSYWHNTTCSDFPTNTAIPEGVCASGNTYYYDSQSVEGNLSVTGGTCAASGGSPNGGATEASPVTVCCQ